MSINKQKPSTILTAKSQYICFNNGNGEDEFDPGYYDGEVIELPTVVKVGVSDNAEAFTSYASGNVYEDGTAISSVELSVENIAFPDALIERMKGNEVVNGVVVGGGAIKRPYFAYGISIKKTDNTLDLRWYPKCKLTENSDDAETKEENHKDQHNTITIKAEGYDEHDNKYVRALTGEGSSADEESFFAAPILTREAAASLRSRSGTEQRSAEAGENGV